jgi:hypothetical protein
VSNNFGDDNRGKNYHDEIKKPMKRRISALKCLGYQTGAKAARAYLNPFYRACLLIPATQLLKVGIPPFFSFIVGMAHVIAHDRFLAAYRAFSRHKYLLNILLRLLKHDG